MTIENIILISFDGVRKTRFEELLNNGYLPNLGNMLSSGSYKSDIVIYPFLVNRSGIITPVNPADILPSDTVYYEQAVTDAGHSQMLTGKYGPNTGICNKVYNQSYDFLCSNNFNTIYSGITLMETLKANTSMAIGVCCSRRADNRDISKNPGYGIFHGFGTDNIYSLTADLDRIGGHGFFSTTFANCISSLDYFFDPKKIGEYTENDAYWNFYTPTGTYSASIELKSTITAQKSNEFINNSISSGKNFFLFVHFCEPDLFGHTYGEGSLEYKEAIVSCDTGVGIIINNLRTMNNYNNTLIVITTDHGAELNSSPATLTTIAGKKYFTKAGNLHGQLDTDNHLIWLINNQTSISTIDQTKIVPLISSALNL